MNNKEEYSEYSWLRNVFWPIYGAENWKFIPMLIMMTLALFVYTTLRIHKDTYILSVASANSTSFLKGYFVLPCSILYMMIFCFFTNKFSKEKVFFLTILPLLFFFILFYLFFLPNSNYLHFSPETLLYLNEKYPNFKNFFPIIGYWTYSLYYIFAELWGTVVITFLFWGFANYSVTTNETKRFYSLFASYSYIGLMLSSYIQSKIFMKMSKYKKGSYEYINVSFINFYLIIGSIILFILLYWFVNNMVLYYENNNLYEEMQFKPKKKPSFISSAKTVISYKYLIYISILVICYGLTTNLIEVTWKEVVKREFCGDAAQMGKYFSDFYFWVGCVTMIFGLINKYINTRFGWKNALLFTPIMVIITAFIFFSLILYGSFISTSILSTSVFLISIKFGFMQDILAKCCKYGIFDPNIQISYIPLDDELKIKGKAAVDIVGGRAGKGLGSILESVSSVVFKGADQIALAPLFMPIVIIACSIWIYFTISLSKEYEKLIANKNENNK